MKGKVEEGFRVLNTLLIIQLFYFHRLFVFHSVATKESKSWSVLLHQYLNKYLNNIKNNKCIENREM